MAQITTLKDRQGQTVYPVTSSKAVFNDKGEDLEALLAAQQRKLDGQLKGYAKTEELQKKQDALSVTEDLRLTNEGLLGLTERAKQRLFDDLWREAVGVWGDIDHSHVEDGVAKPYYLNELWLTYGEAVAVYTAGNPASTACSGRFSGQSIKTHLPPKISTGNMLSDSAAASADYMFSGCAKLEVANFSNFNIEKGYGVFKGCVRLRKILGKFSVKAVKQSLWLARGCPELEEFKLTLLNSDINLQDSPKLNLTTFDHMVRHRYVQAINASGNVTVTVHPDVFAKLTDEANAEWHQVLLDAETKNITFATA